MFDRYEIEEQLEVEYRAKSRPVGEPNRPPQRYSTRFEKRRAPAGTRNGMQRRGTRAKCLSF
jgi:hypothetical protein